MISYTRQCIFIHIPKTGGTSIENLIWPDLEKRTERDLWMGLIDGYHNKFQTGGLQHLLARQVIQEVGLDVYRSFFSFCIVRNPWDKVLSQYVFMQRRKDLRDFVGMEENASLKEYLLLIQKRVHVQWLPQYQFVLDDNGDSLVDFVGRFENFADSVRQILARLGLPVREIPHEKKGDRGNYRSYYDAESIQMVAELYAQDIAMFDYRY